MRDVFEGFFVVLLEGKKHHHSKAAESEQPDERKHRVNVKKEIKRCKKGEGKDEETGQPLEELNMRE